ncbi:MAG: SpoIIE family protein phosphatase [Actinomycetota bacterium]
MNIRPEIFLIVLIFLFSFSTFAQNENEFSLSAEKFAGNQAFELNKPFWKYYAGDNVDWAKPEFDDSEWRFLDPSKLNAESLGKDWDGICWLRTRLTVDESLAGQPLSLMLWQYGASEIYLNGALIQKFGEIGENFDQEYNPQGVPVPLVFSKAGLQTLAVRFSFKTARNLSGGTGRWLAQGHFSPGFFSYLQPSFAAEKSYTARQIELNEYKLFSGILFAFAFLHFLLFIFYRHERANFYYSVFAFFLATGNALSSLFNNSQQPAVTAALTFVLFVVFYTSSFIALLSFLYVAFGEKFSKFFWFLCAYLGFLITFMAIYSRAHFTLLVVVGFILLTVADALRIMIFALRRGKNGAWIIMAGLGVFTLGVLMLVARELQYVEWTGFFEQFRNIALYLAIPIAVSVYLARNFARVNLNLENKLVEVEAFSEREIEHEKEKARMLIVEAESERRARELDEARRLQLSMLPKNLPNIPSLEIAAYMKPATEVGGDYYDFHVGKEGTLTVAVGDATGHGLKAGTMVSVTKGLFNNLASAPEITDTLNQMSRSLKMMNLRGLFMAMTLLKFKDNKLQMSAAGMPSALIYRAAGKIVEEISVRALPLGSIARFNYQKQSFSLAAGDVVLLLSDGFPEMFNEHGEMLGFEKAAEILPQIAADSPEEIIERLVEIGQQWAGTRPPDDDVTFVVLKIV